MISTQTTRTTSRHPVCSFISRPSPLHLAQYHLSKLLAALEQLRHHGPERADGGDVASWADEGYLYLEVSRLESHAPEVDLSVHAGKAFFRVVL